MSTFSTVVSTFKGLQPATVDIEGMHLVNTAQASANAAVGSVFQLDYFRSSSETVTGNRGATGSIWVNLITPINPSTAAFIGTSTYLLALEVTAKGGDNTFRLRGPARALINNGGVGIIAIGGLCQARTTTQGAPLNVLESDPAVQVAGMKFIFRLDEASAAADAGLTLRPGFFDGE